MQVYYLRSHLKFVVLFILLLYVTHFPHLDINVTSCTLKDVYSSLHIKYFSYYFQLLLLCCWFSFKACLAMAFLLAALLSSTHLCLVNFPDRYSLGTSPSQSLVLPNSIPIAFQLLTFSKYVCVASCAFLST